MRVHEDQVLFTAPDRFHGANFVALWNNVGDSPEATHAFAQMGLQLVRFPGGVPCEWYDWQHPLATGWTELTPLRAARFAEAGNAALIFQTNAATDSTGINKKTGETYAFNSSGDHAAAWAIWARQHHIPVAFWEIGNEPEMDAPKPFKSNQEAIYGWYNAKFAQQARAIKAADPQARVMGPAATNTYFWWAQHNLDKFMKAHGNRQGDGLADAVSLHWYPDGGGGSWDQKRGTAQGWQACMDYIRDVIRRYDTRSLPLYITEWNWGAGDHNDSNRKLSNALGCADCIGMFLRTGVSGQTHFCLQHIDHGWGVLATGGESRKANTPNPTYFALAMASHLGGQVLKLDNDADEKNEVSVYATRHDDALQIMVINKSPRWQTVAVNFQNYQTKGKTAQIYTLRGINDSVTDEEVIYNGVRSPLPATTRLPQPLQLDLSGDFAPKIAPCSIALAVFPLH